MEHDLDWHKTTCEKCHHLGGDVWDWCSEAQELLAAEGKPGADALFPPEDDEGADS